MSRPAGTAQRATHRSGMTFIELILALAIVTLVITLVFSVYHTVSVTLRSQEDRRRGADAVADAVRQIARDLECAFAPQSDTACAFKVDKDTPGPASSQLSFCTAVMPEGETDLRWFELHRVLYRIDTGAENAPVLLREHQPLAGPGAFAPAVTNVLAGAVESFRISVYDGSEWKDEWLPVDAVCPRAARIELITRNESGERTFKAEVLIPAGNSVTSTVQRTTAL